MQIELNQTEKMSFEQKHALVVDLKKLAKDHGVELVLLVKMPTEGLFNDKN